MTAKEKLKAAVDRLTEADAARTLDFIVRRVEPTGLDALLDRAPLDDEPTTPEEDEGAREARAEIARGEFVTADELRRELA